ncbi:unnamed protein product [Fructobacillus tropaeoli]|uniref:hypothetical protein n=1 Tax=Fructobacillus tropaeoli TaxID=709323 RepID=UPI002D90CE40|nr:unnamed protein product [Fructobacillus tropaeoli]
MKKIVVDYGDIGLSLTEVTDLSHELSANLSDYLIGFAGIFLVHSDLVNVDDLSAYSRNITVKAPEQVLSLAEFNVLVSVVSKYLTDFKVVYEVVIVNG